jgi:xanthine dehydrogenase iron-sulfur cluster and FAD-binding subunit A
MKTFQYTTVSTIEEAVSLLAEHGKDAAVLAGGTDLMIEFRRSAAKIPKIVIDISRVRELGGITESPSGILLSPLTTHRQILQSGLIREFGPLLASAASSVGSPQIRSRGTVGGNIMNAAACADTVPPLIALGATVALRSAKGVREMSLADLFNKPYETKARPDELLIGISFRKLSPDSRTVFLKLGRRNALSISRLSAAVILTMGADGRITDARIVPGAAFPTWRRVSEAEQMLIGEKPSAKLFTAAGTKVSEAMIGETGRRWSTEYKEPVIAALVRRALTACSLSPASEKTGVRSAVPQFSTVPEGMPAAIKSSVQSGSVNCTITVTINQRRHTLTIPVNRTLLDVLREDCGLTGTKCGCEVGECGACTVILDGEAVNSCLVLAPQIDGRTITTVEGLMQNGRLHPLQESFLDHDSAHCGFCTPGMLMSAKALLDRDPRPTEKDIRTAISGNL